MDFANTTPFPAKLLSGSTGDREMVCIVAAKVTYSLQDGALVPVVPAQSWPVFEKPFVFEGVTLAAETDFRKKGIDVLVFGKAMALNGTPVRQMVAGVECGKMRHFAAVFGDRAWRRSLAGGIQASEPAAFAEMALTNDRAFGGKAICSGQELPHPVNPDGKGFCMEKECAAGTPLPNLERTDGLIQGWKDQPRPACFFKPKGIPNMPAAKVKDLMEVIPGIVESSFNQAVPEMVSKPEEWGSTLRLAGFSVQGDILFPAPRLHGPTAHASIGGRRSRFPSTLSTVVVLAPHRVLVATYLCLFRYLFSPLEKRSLELRWGEDPRVLPVKVTRKP